MKYLKLMEDDLLLECNYRDIYCTMIKKLISTLAIVIVIFLLSLSTTFNHEPQ